MAIFGANEDPNTFEEVVRHSVWRKAMDAEIYAIERSNIWELTALPLVLRQ